MIVLLMALPFGSGYPLQSPDEKSGGFPLLSLTRKGGGQLITDFYNNCKLMFTMWTKATTRNCRGLETWQSRVLEVITFSIRLNLVHLILLTASLLEVKLASN